MPDDINIVFQVQILIPQKDDLPERDVNAGAGRNHLPGAAGRSHCRIVEAEDEPTWTGSRSAGFAAITRKLRLTDTSTNAIESQVVESL